MVPSFLLLPPPTPVNDSGRAGTVLPILPFFTYDGGTVAHVSNPPIDGGTAFFQPVIFIDGGFA